MLFCDVGLIKFILIIFRFGLVVDLIVFFFVDFLVFGEWVVIGFFEGISMLFCCNSWEV